MHLFYFRKNKEDLNLPLKTISHSINKRNQPHKLPTTKFSSLFFLEIVIDCSGPMCEVIC